MPQNTKLARSAKVAEKAKINSLRLISLQSRIDESINPWQVEELFASVNQKVRFNYQTKGRITCYVDFDFAAGDEEEVEPFLTIQASFELVYEIGKQQKITKADAKSFCELNAVFNAWPYWRELLQNQMSRMNCPPIIVPLFKLPASPKK